MGWFHKKSDPISERARSLNEQIASLEAQIKKLNHAPVPPPSSQPPSAPPPAPPAQSHQAPPGPQPRLRSTALPHGARIAAAGPTSPTASPELIFEAPSPFKPVLPLASAPSERNGELGVRKYDLATFWKRLKNNFRGPATSNPKLVNYLAAGSIQGLRPLRYEKRVARNRFILFVALLVLALWGVIAMFFRHR